MSSINSSEYQYYQKVAINPFNMTYTFLSDPIAATNWIGDSTSDTTPHDGSTSRSQVPISIELEGETLFWENPNDPTLTGRALYTGYSVNTCPIIKVTNIYGKSEYYLLYTAPPGDSPMNSEIYYYCFVRGTRIATPSGERPVEQLAIGDAVTTADGGMADVRWIGRQTVNPLIARLSGQLPVRIEAGALGDGLPVRDLFVSPDHALLVDGVLVHAAALVNGKSIVQMAFWPRDIEYFHIETAAHQVILAEGAAAETFIDNVSRERFDNHAEYAALYPDATPIAELDLPRVKFARQLPRAIAGRLDAVAETLRAARTLAA